MSEPAPLQELQQPNMPEVSETPLAPKSSARVNRRVLFWVLLIGLVAIDQIVKAWTRNAADETIGRTFAVLWPGVFELKFTTNKGIAFGWFQGGGIWLAPVAVAIAIGAIWYNLTHPYESRWAHASAALLASGALGNLYDRIFLGEVTDMFYFRLIDFPVFNVADACITAAACMLIISWIREAFEPREPEQPVPAVETSASTTE